MPSIRRDFLETVGSVVTPPGENPDSLVHNVHLHTVAIELDLMNPSVAAGDLGD